MENLVTGGAGFIGCNLTRALLAEGKSVRIFDNFSTGRRENLNGIESDVDLVEGDLRDADAVKKAVQGVRHIFHFGALPSVIHSVKDPLSTNDVNINGTLNLLLAARDAGVERLVFSSSSSVYGDTPTLPKVETMKPMPLSPYALSKLAGEHYCTIFHRLYGLKTFSLRYFNVFGPRQDPASHYAAVIPLFIDAFSHHRAPMIYGDGTQTRDFTYVENVLRANLACRTAPEESAGCVCNAACGDRISVNELAGKIKAMTGSTAEPEYYHARAGEVRDSQADNALAHKKLGWTPVVPFAEGLEKTVAWFTKA
ncbi:MAG: SDR family oxidoreductase [Kiritimatiellae bacterium]|nr:SDR family oxidoreductase [Kiritimatiellia bacterium]